MKRKKLPFNAQTIPPLPGTNTVDSIMIQPRSHGVLNAGQFHKGQNPSFRLQVDTTNKDNVISEDKMLGNEDNYTLIYEVSNYNDSPAFAQLIDNNAQTTVYPCPLCAQKTPRSFMNKQPSGLFYCSQCNNSKTEEEIKELLKN